MNITVFEMPVGHRTPEWSEENVEVKSFAEKSGLEIQGCQKDVMSRDTGVRRMTKIE